MGHSWPLKATPRGRSPPDSLFSPKACYCCHLRRTILWLISQYMNLPQYMFWESTISFSLERVPFQCFFFSSPLVGIVSCDKRSCQRSPETNQYFNKVRFISFSSLSPPSREIVLNHRNMMNTDHLQVYCFSVPSRWYKGRTAVMKQDSDQGQNLTTPTWNAFWKGQVSAFPKVNFLYLPFRQGLSKISI